MVKENFDFERHRLKIDESLQRIDGKNVITAPKTKKSIRTIVMPEFLTDEIKEYIDISYKLKTKDLIFNFSKSYLQHEIDRCSKKSQVKRIRIHDLKHSHVSILIELEFSATAIADRVGHELIDITYIC